MRFLNTFNRVVIVILCLVLMVALTVTFILPGVVLTTVGQWLLDWGTFFQTTDPVPTILIGALLALVVVVALAAIIYMEVRRRRDTFIRVQQVAGGMANVSTTSVTEMLRHRLDAMPGVVEVDPHVQARGNRVHVSTEVSVFRGTHVPETANRVIKEIQQVLTDELGLQIAGQPEVQVTVLREEERIPEEERPSEVEAAPAPPVTTPEPQPVYGAGGRYESVEEPVEAPEAPPVPSQEEWVVPEVTQAESEQVVTEEEEEESWIPPEAQEGTTTRDDRTEAVG